MRTTLTGIFALAIIFILTVQAQANSVDPLQPAGGGSGIVNAPGILVGDANNDGIVDAADYIILKSHIGLGPNATASEGDWSGDGYVGTEDMRLLAANFGQTSEVVAIPPPAVPEPITMGLFTLGLVAVGTKLRGRLKRAS